MKTHFLIGKFFLCIPLPHIYIYTVQQFFFYSFPPPHLVPPTPTLTCTAFHSLSPSSDLPLPLKPLLFPGSYFPSVHTPDTLSHVYGKRSPSCSNYPLSHLNLFTCWSPRWCVLTTTNTTSQLNVAESFRIALNLNLQSTTPLIAP